MQNLLFILFLTSCSWESTFFEKSIQFNGSDISNVSLALSPLYPNNGRNWNDYVADDGNDQLSATDTTCNPAQNCIHGAVLRKAVVTGVTSCAGLGLEDNMSAFFWRCESVSGSIEFRSLGFKPGKGLKDLIATNGTWKSMSVTLNAGSATLITPATQWWNNPITALPNNSVSGTVEVLATAGTIYYLSVSRASAGYKIAADRISIVAGTGAQIAYANVAANNCNSSDGTTVAPNSRCLIFSNNSKYIWVEGNFTAVSGAETNPANFGVLFNTARFIRLQQNKISNFTQQGIFFAIVQRSSILETQVANTPNNASIEVDDSSYIIMGAIQVSSAGQGSYIYHSDHVYVTSMTSQNNSSYSIEFDGCTNCHAAGVTVIGSGYAGLDFWFGVDVIVHNFLGGNVSPSPLSFGNSNGVYVSQISAFNSPTGVAFDTTTVLRARGNFLLSGNATPCSNTMATTSDLDGSCVPGGGVTANVQTLGANLNASIKGLVNADTVSPMASSGTVGYPAAGFLATIDWLKFDSVYRALGPNDATFPSATSMNRWSAGTGRIYDSRILATDNKILNRSHDLNVASLSTVLTGQNCPSPELAADETIQLNGFTYLKNAIELNGYAVGNGNGLCESNEVCLYTPNYGAYQGEGNYFSKSCQIPISSTPGLVSNVLIFSYPTNGVN